jgi:Mn-dependent DtxR family transcriptional regulator
MLATKGAFDNHKEPDVIEIVKEDILRILCERSKKTSLKVIKDEIKVAHLILSKAIEELEGDNLIAIQEGFILLIEAGRENAKIILKKHFVLEDYFEKNGLAWKIIYSFSIRAGLHRTGN